MPDSPQNPPRSISEIGHLFLSGVRDKQTASAPRPVRTPPGGRPPIEVPPAPIAPTPSVDLTPEELAGVFDGDPAGEASTQDAGDLRIPPVTAVIAQHLNGRAAERVKEYARHLAANGERVGLLEVDAGEIRLMCFERSIDPNTADPEPAATGDQFDARFVTECLDEMSWDLDRWLLVLPNLRSPEARALLKEVDHWALLSTCDHDGVVSCYRTLKGLASVHRPGRMTLALMEAPAEALAAKVFRKLSGVSLQFLGLELESEPAVRPTRAVAEHLVAHTRLNRDKAQLAAGAQWLVVNDFVARAKAQEPAENHEGRGGNDEGRNSKNESMTNDEAAEMTETQTEMPVPLNDVTIPMPVQPVAPSAPAPVPAPSAPSLLTTNNWQLTTPAVDEVLDLPTGVADEASVLSAILAGSRAELIECPVRAPMCPDARLAVTRDRGLIVLAVARKGLSELRQIAQAYRWTIENRALIAMAVPQLSLDAHQHPRLRLLVDHADLTADALAPMLETATVTVQAYRKLRWAGKTGLLLEAA